METQQTRRTFEDWANRHKTHYVELPQCRIHEYSGSIEIVLLGNAMEKGKECPRFSINWDHHRNDCPFLNWIGDKFDYDVLPLIAHLLSYEFVDGDYKGKDINGDLQLFRTNVPSFRVFSPFNNGAYKPLKELPSKWNLTAALRALVNKQVKNPKCTGVYTDDYAWDAATNYRRGEIDPVMFAKDIIESPSGWRTYLTDSGKVVINCHHFDNNEFELNLGA